MGKLPVFLDVFSLSTFCPYTFCLIIPFVRISFVALDILSLYVLSHFTLFHFRRFVRIRFVSLDVLSLHLLSLYVLSLYVLSLDVSSQNPISSSPPDLVLSNHAKKRSLNISEAAPFSNYYILIIIYCNTQRWAPANFSLVRFRWSAIQKQCFRFALVRYFQRLVSLLALVRYSAIAIFSVVRWQRCHQSGPLFRYRYFFPRTPLMQSFSFSHKL